MKTRMSAIAIATGLALALPVQAANYSYHGELMDGDVPAQGKYDLRVRSYADPVADKARALATELPAVTLVDGRFSVQLDLPDDADGTTWVDVSVRKSESGDDYETLGDPIAVAKGSATCPGAWALDGNSALPAGSFLGTVDADAVLELKAGARRVARIVPAGNAISWGDAPNIAMGSSGNVAGGTGVAGATVAGGGAILGPSEEPCAVSCTNRATGSFSTVGGGQGNQAMLDRSTVAGGYFNRAEGGSSVVGGGESNQAASYGSTVGGGNGNRATGGQSAVGGGGNNGARAEFSVVSGGFSNVASGYSSVVAGGNSNCAGGDYSWATGRLAKIRPGVDPNNFSACDELPSYSGDANGDEGTFAWADAQASNFVSSGPNQFLVRADGGVGINTARFGNAVDLRASELIIKNSTIDPNVDLTLLNGTNRGYGLAVVPGAGGAAGEFLISETDARTASVGFFNRFRIDATGTTFVQGGAVGNLSDARLKKNIGAIEAPLDTLLSLQGHVFEYIDPAASMNAPGLRMGFIAQDVQKAIPGWVRPTGSAGHLAVTPIGFEALTVEAIRDLKAEGDVRIEALEAQSQAQIARLDAENAQLRTALATLAARLARVEASTRGRE